MLGYETGNVEDAVTFAKPAIPPLHSLGGKPPLEILSNYKELYNSAMQDGRLPDAAQALRQVGLMVEYSKTLGRPVMILEESYADLLKDFRSNPSSSWFFRDNGNLRTELAPDSMVTLDNLLLVMADEHKPFNERVEADFHFTHLLNILNKTGFDISPYALNKTINAAEKPDNN